MGRVGQWRAGGWHCLAARVCGSERPDGAFTSWKVMARSSSGTRSTQAYSSRTAPTRISDSLRPGQAAAPGAGRRDMEGTSGINRGGTMLLPTPGRSTLALGTPGEHGQRGEYSKRLSH